MRPISGSSRNRCVPSAFVGWFAALVAWAAFAGPFASAQPADEQPKNRPRRNLVVDDLFELRRVGDPQLSPDGAWVAYTVSTTQLKEEKSATRIWMTSVDSKRHIPMTSTKYSSTRPRWSPDGKYLAFLSAREKDKSQVWLLNRLGGEASQVTEVVQGVRSFEWCPDSMKIALVIQDPTEEERAKAASNGAGEKGTSNKSDKTKPPWVIDRLQFKYDGVGYLDRRRTHLYVLDVETKQVRQVTSGDHDDSNPAWSPDGKLIAFESNRTKEPDSNFNTDIWVVAADNPDQGQTLIQVTTNSGSDGAPSWSPDGEWIVYTSATDAQAIVFATNHLAVSPSRGGPSRVLTKSLDRNCYVPQFSEDGDTIYALLEDQGERHLAAFDVENGEIRRPISGFRSVRSFHRGIGDRIVAQISEPDRPFELFIKNPESDERHQLTKLNAPLLDKVRLAAVEKVRFESKDGTPVEGFIYKPPAFVEGVRYPTLLWIHGGPVAQYEAQFNFLAQLFAAHGYVVALANPRGSSGYGQAFSMEIFADWGNKDFEDVMAIVDYAIDQGYADANRLGVGGWSYGGILTNYVITKTDRFKGAITGASLVLYAANYGHDHYQRWYEAEFGLPWENRELWERLSPFNSVEQIVTPTLIMGGEVDWNVPILNSEQLYQALKRLGRTTQLVVYPGQTHGISKPSYQKDRYERYLAWFEKYVKGEGKAPQ